MYIQQWHSQVRVIWGGRGLGGGGGGPAYRADARRCTDELSVSFKLMGPWDEFKFIIETLRVETVVN